MSRFILCCCLILTLLLPSSARADITLFGYTGVAGAEGSKLSQIKAAGIRTNVNMVDFPEVWTNTNLGAITAEFQANGVKTALFLDSVLLRKFYVASSPCVDAGGPFTWSLRHNWQDRLRNFAATNGAHISPAKTAFISVTTEQNNGCTPLDQINTAAAAVKSYFPGIPTVMGYGREPGSQPAPAYIPFNIDYVGFFKYGIYDVNNPSHPYNADNQYLVEFNSLVSKLAMHQRIILVPDGFWGRHLHAGLPNHLGTTGWPLWYLAPVATNYEKFAASQPRVIGLLFFTWSRPGDPNLLGTYELPQDVRDAHRAIACRRLGCL